MGLWVPDGAEEFTWQISSISTQRPATAMGQFITPGASNVKGNYNVILSGSQVTNDIYAVWINFNTGFTAANARNILADVGIDTNGGTNYQVLIPNLLASCAAGLNLGPGINYYFPIKIPKGSQVGVRAQVNNATAGGLRCFMQAFGVPSDPTRVRAGTYCDSVGVTTATSSGTTVTAGTTSDGAWTSLGTTSREAWWWQLGMGINDTTMTSTNNYAGGLSVGTVNQKDIIVRDQHFLIAAANEHLATPGKFLGCLRSARSGTTVYGRLQCNGTADSALSMAAWYVGG